jgi:hypothetical protein
MTRALIPWLLVQNPARAKMPHAFKKSKPRSRAGWNPREIETPGVGHGEISGVGKSAWESGQDTVPLGAREIGEARPGKGEYADGARVQAPLGCMSGLRAKDFARGAYPWREFTGAEQNRQDIGRREGQQQTSQSEYGIRLPDAIRRAPGESSRRGRSARCACAGGRGRGRRPWVVGLPSCRGPAGSKAPERQGGERRRCPPAPAESC